MSSQRLICIALAGLAVLGCQYRSGHRRADSQPEIRTMGAEELFQIAVWHARRGDLLRAEQYLNAARHESYDEGEVVYWLVRVCIAGGRYHSALRHAAAYLRTAPANWQLRLVVASIYEALGDLHEAQVELERVVSAQPSAALAHYKLALLYSRQPLQAQRASTHLKAYLALAPRGAHAPEVQDLLVEVSRPTARDENASIAGGGIVEKELP